MSYKDQFDALVQNKKTAAAPAPSANTGSYKDQFDALVKRQPEKKPAAQPVQERMPEPVPYREHTKLYAYDPANDQRKSAREAALEQLAQEATQEKPKLGERIRNFFAGITETGEERSARLSTLGTESGDAEIDAYITNTRKNAEQAIDYGARGQLGQTVAGGVQQAFGAVSNALAAATARGANVKRNEGAPTLGTSSGDAEIDAYLEKTTENARNATTVTEEREKKLAEISKAAEQQADRYAEMGQKNLDTAKSNSTAFGKLGVDIGSQAVQMAIDLAVGTATGTGAMAPMAIRSFGMGAQQARQKGYDELDQFRLGVTSAMIEYFTEKLFGGNPVYDSDVGLVNRLVGRVTKNKAFSETLMKVLASTPFDVLNEGLEEILSDIANPLAEMAITGNYDAPTLDEVIYDGAIGAAMSILGLGGRAALNTFAPGITGMEEAAQFEQTQQQEPTAAQVETFAQEMTENEESALQDQPAGDTIIQETAAQEQAPAKQTEQTAQQATKQATQSRADRYNREFVNSFVDTDVNYGSAGRLAMKDFFNDGEDGLAYLEGMTAYYNAGKASVSNPEIDIDSVPKSAAAATINDAQARAAFLAGQADAERTARTTINNALAAQEIKEDMSYGEAETGAEAGSNGNGAGSVGLYTQRSGVETGRVDAGAAADRAGNAVLGEVERTGSERTQAREDAKDAEISAAELVEEADAASLGIAGGDSSVKVRVVKAGSTAAMRNAEKIAAKSGHKITAFAGGYLTVGNNKGIQAASLPNGDIIVSADDPEFEMDRLTGHEVCEDEIRRGVVSVKGAIQAARDRVGDYVLNEIIKDYKTLGYDAKELVCDGAGNINRFASMADGNDFLTALKNATDEVLDAIHEYVNVNGAYDDVPALAGRETQYSRRSNNLSDLEVNNADQENDNGRNPSARGTSRGGNSEVESGERDPAGFRERNGRSDRANDSGQNTRAGARPVNEWSDYEVYRATELIIAKAEKAVGYKITKAFPSEEVAIRFFMENANVPEVAADIDAVFPGVIDAAKKISEFINRDFGDYSKTVPANAFTDGSGNPVKLYHGGGRSGLDLYFGAWFTPSRAYAEEFSKTDVKEAYAGGEKTANIGELDDKLQPKDISRLAKAIGADDADVQSIADSEGAKRPFDITRTRDYIALAIKNGYDSFEATESGTKTYCVFGSKEQIQPLNENETQFSMAAPVEETQKLLALHNMTENNLRGALELGGLPMPSIAVVRADTGHTKYGPISVVFDKSSIDPRASSLNKVYGSDAWTPTAPQIGYKYSDRVISSMRSKVESIIGADLYRELNPSLDSSNINDKVLRNNGSFAEAYRDSVALKLAYLKESGKQISVPTMQRKYSAPTAVLKQLAKTIDVEALREMPYAEEIKYEPQVRQALYDYELNCPEYQSVTDNGKTIAQVRAEVMYGEQLSYKTFQDAINDAASIKRYGVRKETDVNKLKARVDGLLKSKKAAADYDAWLSDLSDGLIEKKGIRNNKDPYTSVGNRRSFEALYDEYTLDNIVRAMRGQEERGGQTFGVNSKTLQSVTTPAYGSIAEIRQDSGRLGKLDEGQYEALNKEIDDDLMQAIDDIFNSTEHFDDNRFIEYDNIAEAVIKAARRGTAPEGIARSFARDGYSINRDIAEKLSEIFKRTKTLPTEYFEAKPQRAIRLDESLAIVVPSDMNKELKQSLADAGAKVITYKAGDEADRLKKINSVQGAQFSTAAGKEAVLALNSRGEELTQQQTDFFQNSKMRDDQGRLQVMYRGGNDDFTVFDRRKSKGSNLYGRGFYFTADERMAQTYGNARSFYLNIENPLSPGQNKITKAQMRAFLKAVAEDEDYGLENYGYGATVESVLRDVYGKGDFEMLQDVNATAVGDLVAAIELFNDVNGTDYDGIILPTETVTFRSNQAKNIDNDTPTDNPDIRYSAAAGRENVNALARMTTARIDGLIEDSGAGKSKTYAQKWITSINPADFLDLTLKAESQNREQFDSRPGDYGETVNDGNYVAYLKKETRQTPFIEVYPDGTIAGHEGRHRMRALEKEGITSAEIVVMFVDEDGRLMKGVNNINGRLESLKQIRIYNQYGTGQRAVLKNVIPLNLDHREEILAYYGADNAEAGDVVYSSAAEAESLKTLQAENKRLQKQVEELKAQMKLTDRSKATFRSGDVKKAARELIGSNNSAMSTEEVAEKLTPIYKFIAEGGADGDELTYSGLMDRVAPLARDLADSATIMRSTDYESYKALKDYLKSTKIAVSQADRADVNNGDYESFRKSMFGTMTLSTTGVPVDAAYAELQEIMGKGYFPEDITHPADQIERIAYVVDCIRPAAENPYSLDMAEATGYIANEIIDSYFAVRETPPTFADKAKADKNAALAKQKAQMQEAKAEALERAARQRDAALRKAKQHFKEVNDARRERKTEAADRVKLLKVAKRLKKIKTTAANRALLNEILKNLDTVSVNITGKTLNNLAELREWYEQQAESPDFISSPAIEEKLKRLYTMKIGDMNIEQVRELTDVLRGIENGIRNQGRMISVINGKTVYRYGARDAYMMGLDTINDVSNSAGTKKNLRDWLVTNELTPERFMHRITGYNEDDPLYLATKALSDGQRIMFDYQRRAQKMFQRFMDDRKFMNSVRGKKAEKIEVAGMKDGETVKATITPDMRMSLYLHSLNDQNLRHAATGGVTIPDAELLAKGKVAEAYARGVTIKMTPSNIRRIAEGMSAKERAYVEAAHKYFNTMSPDEINAVSEALVGWSIAGVENYFPINTDSRFSKREFETLQKDGTIEGMGFLKERVNAANPMMLRGLTDVLNQSISMNSKYVGLAVPVRNFNMLWNTTKTIVGEDGTAERFAGSVQEAIEKKWGTRATSYVEKLMTDVQSAGQPSEELDKFFGKLRSNYAGAVLSLNASVAIKQAASYPTAAATLGWGPIAKAMTKMGPVDLELINKYTPLLWYRSLGYSSQELGDIASRKDSLMNRLMSAKVTIKGYDVATLNWIQAVDLLTTRKLWKASEIYVQQHNKDLARGSEEYYNAVAEIYNRVIEETQPNYTTLQRPQILRSNSTLTQSVVTFKTQPFQNFNIVYDAIANMEAKKRAYNNVGTAESKAAYTEAKKNAGNAVSSQIVSAVVFSAMTAVASLVMRRFKKRYSDDDGELTKKSVIARFAKDLVGNFAGMFVGGTEALDLANSLIFRDPYYGPDAINISAASDAATAIINFSNYAQSVAEDAINGEGVDLQKMRIKMTGAAEDISKLFGVPVENVNNIFESAFKTSAEAAGGKYLGQYAYLMLTEDMKAKASDFYKNLYDAYRNDADAYANLYDNMIEDGFDPDKIKNYFEKQMKKAEGVESVDDLSERYLAPAQKKAYDDAMKTLATDNVYVSLSKEKRDGVDSFVFDYAADNSAWDKTTEKFDGYKSVGLDEVDLLEFLCCRSYQDEKNDSGKYGTYTNSEIEYAIRTMAGRDGSKLTKLQKNFLWTASGKNPDKIPEW